MPMSNEQKPDHKLLFVVNPIAGGLEKDELLEDLPRIAKQLKFDYELLETTGKDDPQMVKSAIASYRPSTVMAVGGDGTANMIGQLLVDTDLPLGIIPFGSANGMAKELQIPEDYEEAIAVALKGKMLRIDVLVINRKHYCLRIADIGINARIIKRFEKSKKRGMLSYAKHFFEELIRSRAKKVRIESGGKLIKKRVHMVAIANATRYGTGAIINPVGRLDDGKFEICLIKRVSLRAMLHLLRTFILGKMSGTEYLEIFSREEVDIFFKRPRTLQMDGELMGKHSSVSVQIKPNCLSILVAD